MKHVTLIGSRKAPLDILNDAIRIGRQLAIMKIPMFSGGADGMDSAFEQGYNEVRAQKLENIILPQNGFNSKVHTKGSQFYPLERYNKKLIEKAEDIVSQIHPHWPLSGFARRAHTRNVFQVLGHDLNSPAEAVILYAPINGNSVKGGTRTAFEIAKQNGIKTYNLYDPKEYNEIHKLLKIKKFRLDDL